MNDINTAEATLNSVAYGTEYLRVGGHFDLLFSGAGLGTALVQKSIIDPAGTPAWYDVQSFTVDGNSQTHPAYEPVLAWYRVGFTAHTSGTTVFILRAIAKGAK